MHKNTQINIQKRTRTSDDKVCLFEPLLSTPKLLYSCIYINTYQWYK